MKKYFLIPITLLGTALLAQFNIDGQITNYSNKPVLVKIFENGNAKTIKTITTDVNGKFSSRVPVSYAGIIRLEMPSGANINILSDNENIKFKTNYDETIQTGLEVLEGKAQKEYTSLQKLNPLNDLNKNVFPHIKKMYNVNETFYKAIEVEEERITKLNASQTISSPLVKYIQGLENLIGEIKNNPSEATANKILNHIESDDEKLEQSGHLSDILYGYLNYQFTKNSSETPENNLKLATEALLQKGNIETERGQNILSTIFTLVPEQNFPIFFNEYKTKVNNLTCKVTEDLKSKINGATDLKVGDKAPNINFEKSVKGKKSLYDIKANQKLVVFWASWCPACLKELPYIKEFYSDFKKNGGEIIAIALDYDQNEYDKATKDFEWYNYTDLLRWDSPIAEAYKVNSTPTLFLLDKDNKIIQKANHVTDFQVSK